MNVDSEIEHAVDAVLAELPKRDMLPEAATFHLQRAMTALATCVPGVSKHYSSFRIVREFVGRLGQYVDDVRLHQTEQRLLAEFPTYH